MATTLRETVTLFLRNLDLQLEDLKLEESDIPVDLYFDTVDASHAVMGMQAFYTPGVGFDRDFFREETLVDCLAANGWLGPVQMLPPHQAEFLAGLKLNFGVGRNEEVNPREFAHKFLEAASEVGAISYEASSLGAFSREELVQFVRKHAGSAISLFKAFQCIRGGTWENRLSQLREQGYMLLDPNPLDYISLIHSPEFDKVKQSFDRRRRTKPVSNFADAAAVVSLISLVRDFNTGKAKRLPRFFVSTPVFQKAVEAAGVDKQLVYETPSGIRGDVLRNSNYFVFRQVFRPPVELVDDSHKPRFSPDAVDLHKLRDQISGILETPKDLLRELQRIKIADVPLDKVILELKEFSFFENVWLPFSAESEMRAAIEELDQIARQLKTVEFQHGVEEGLRATEQALTTNAREYQWVGELWTKLDDAAQTMVRRKAKMTNRATDYFRDLGLLRFSFPKETHEEIGKHLNGLFSGNDVEERHVRTFVIKACYKEYGIPGKNLRELVVTVAALWIADLDAHIIELLDTIGVDRLPHDSLKTIFAAATFRIKKGINQGRLVLEGLETKYLRDQKDADLAVGIAYLHFHLWKCLEYKAPWRGGVSLFAESMANDGTVLICKAIQYAKQARELLRLARDQEGKAKADRRKEIYALNQYLYYMIEGGDDSFNERIDAAETELAEYKNNRDLWQYRFDDTLARHFHRKAVSTDDEERWTFLSKSALRHSEQACAAAYGDEEIESYRTILESGIAAGFGGRRYEAS
jgi:hypothetical protein